MINYILIGVSVLFIIIGLILKKKQRSASSDSKKKGKLAKKFPMLLIILGGYIIITRILSIAFGNVEGRELEVSIWADRVDIFGYSLSSTVIYSWVVMAVLVVIAIILRITVVPKLKTVPSGCQNVLETMIEYIEKYTKTQTGGLGDGLNSYIFTIAAFLIGCAFLELFGLRAPTADITMTFALSLITFILINYYSIKKKGVGGRIKSLAQPVPVVFPMKIISDLAVPVSMACRLFGNMLGGMIVMDLLYVALSTNAVGIPSLVALYFNVFHPLIQAFIFVTLTLTFINEAVE